MPAHEHRTHRSGWLRASVLGANDGVLSISGLMLGVAAAHASTATLIVSGCAGLVAGALSMAAGEYVSVSSQADIERADLDIEREALRNDYDAEHVELRDIYIQRGLDHELATEVARQLMQHDALGAHARDDIGITDALSAKPLQAAVASSISFATGGSIPLLAAIVSPKGTTGPSIATASFLILGVLGAFAARSGGAPILKGALRTLLWGALAMGVTSAIGTLFGAG